MEPGPEKLGKLLRDRRKQLGLSQQNVEEATRKFGAQVSAQFLSDTERAYPRKGGRVTLPSYDKLRALGHVLDIPLHDLQAALGRVDDSAQSLVREAVARYGDDRQIAPETIDRIHRLVGGEAEDYVRVRVERIMRDLEKQEQAA